MSECTPHVPVEELEFFEQFRTTLFYTSSRFKSPFGKEVPVIYTDSTAMGLPLRSIEDVILELVAPGDLQRIHDAYDEAMDRLTRQLHAGDQFALLPVGTGCTAAMNVLTRDILGYRLPDYWDQDRIVELIPEDALPILITTMMEHHSADLVLRECLYKRLIHLGFDDAGKPDLHALERHLAQARDEAANPILITCTAGSNVTGIQPDLCRLVSLGHQYGALSALDYAAAGPYAALHLEDCQADAVGLSPHKFPGGPQACGLLCVRRDSFDEKRLVLPAPRISTMIELIRIGEVMRIKKQMRVPQIRSVVRYFAQVALQRLSRVAEIEVIGGTDLDRFAIISFVVRSRYNTTDNPPPSSLMPYLLPHPLGDGTIVYYVHHNLIAKLLNDLFGIQVRPGCSCAGPYGHWLLQISDEESDYHRDRINRGLFDQKPGWIRVTFNEMNSIDEVETVLNAVEEISRGWDEYAPAYGQDRGNGEFAHRDQVVRRVGIADWSMLQDQEETPSSPAIESFIRSEILPFAANTHTEINFTGTTSTYWYHWAQNTIRGCLGAPNGYGLRFIRAGYDPLRVLLYHLGAELPGGLEDAYGISRTVSEDARVRLVTLGDPLSRPGLSLIATVAPCDSVEEVMETARAEPDRTIVLAGFDDRLPLPDPRSLASALHDIGVRLIADLTAGLGKIEMQMARDHIAGGIVSTERLPGGWQTHPILLLEEPLFRNTIPLDVGGGIVYWTTKTSHRYVEDRTVLEDAGTPGIIQAIRTGLVIGRHVNCRVEGFEAGGDGLSQSMSVEI